MFVSFSNRSAAICFFKLLLTVVILIFASGRSVAEDVTSQRSDKLADQVSKMFSQWDRPDVPGCAVGIVHKGKIVFSKGFGSANLDYEIPNTSQTVFEVGSMTKTFTAACIALLLDQHKISPDDDIRKYIPEIHKHNPPIRIRHLIRCRSGLWAQWHIVQLAGWSSEPIESPYTQDDLLALVAGQKSLPFEPGSRFRYGSTDYFLLGIIVQRVTGQSLADFARNNLFDPLGMSRTYFSQDPTRVVKHRAVGHYRQNNSFWQQWTMNTSTTGGWGLKTCVEDLVRWDRNFFENRLPKGKYLETFLREGTLLDNRNVLDSNPTGKYRGLKRIQFTGGMPGFHAGIARFPEQQFTVICLSNNGNIYPWETAKQIADLYLDDELQPLPKKKKTDKQKPLEFVELPENELRNKVGTYRMKRHGRIWRVLFKDGDLFWTSDLKKTAPLKAISATRFHPEGLPEENHNVFEFQRSAPDEPLSLTLKWDSGSLQFERVNLVDPAKLKPDEYTGEYYSDELKTTYRFRVRGAHLWLRVGNRRWEQLDPTVTDQFIPNVRREFDNRIFTFRRDKQNRIAGVSVSLWRVTGLDFVKK